MNDPFDQLEQELRSLTPRRPSNAARQHFARRARSRRQRSLVLFAVASVAASIVVALFLGPSDGPEADHVDRASVAADGPLVEPEFVERISRKDSGDLRPDPPTVWAFRRAASESIDELDALLAQRDAKQPPIDLPPRSAFGRGTSAGMF